MPSAASDLPRLLAAFIFDALAKGDSMFLTKKAFEREMARQIGIRNAAIHALSTAFGVAIARSPNADRILSDLKEIVSKGIKTVEAPTVDPQEYRNTLSIVLATMIEVATTARGGMSGR